MSDSWYTSGRARALEQTAQRCRTLAETLERRRLAISERHEPVIALHREAIWKGRAASASRERLHNVIGAALYSVDLDLALTVRGLHREAAELDMQASEVRREISRIDELWDLPSAPTADGADCDFIHCI